MGGEPRSIDRPWVPPEVCPNVLRPPKLSLELHRAIDQAEAALDRGSLGKAMHALVAMRAALQSRLAEDSPRDASPAGSEGPWQRRLRRRYAASLCAVERMLERGWTSFDIDELGASMRPELSKLRRLESLENQAYLDRYWTDLGVGD